MRLSVPLLSSRGMSRSDGSIDRLDSSLPPPLQTEHANSRTDKTLSRSNGASHRHHLRDDYDSEEDDQDDDDDDDDDEDNDGNFGSSKKRLRPPRPPKGLSTSPFPLFIHESHTSRQHLDNITKQDEDFFYLDGRRSSSRIQHQRVSYRIESSSDEEQDESDQEEPPPEGFESIGMPEGESSLSCRFGRKKNNKTRL